MPTVIELLLDNRTIPGRVVTSIVVVLVAFVLAGLIGRLVARRVEDRYSRYYARKFTRYGIAALTLVVLAVLWRAFAGRAGVVLGLAAAGVAFAMQEVIGAFAGWFNILSGRIFQVGDRIQMGGVRGDVIDITPLRTKIMEMGSDADDAAWVKGRQYTGRIVAISNKATFTEPVFNYSSAFDYIWEELTLPLPHGEAWEPAERILQEEVERASSSEGARAAIDAMTRRYPIARADVEPRVFVRAGEGSIDVSARFVVPVRSARRVKDEVTRRVLERFQAAGIETATTTADVTILADDEGDARP